MNSPTLVLLHGAWHAGSCWAEVAGLLTARGFRVLTPDLPGHGSSTLALQKVTLKAYVKAVLELLDSIEGSVMLIGHSMAGIVISQVAAQAPQRLAGLVYLAAYLPRHDESLFDLIALNRGHEPLTPIELAMQISADKRICSIPDEDIIPLFYPLAPAELAEQARCHFSIQATLPLAAKVDLETVTSARAPCTYILTTQDKVIPLHHQRRMLARRSCDAVLQIDADHSPFLSRPAELAALLAATAERSLRLGQHPDSDNPAEMR